MTEKRNRNGTSRRGGEDGEISEAQDEAPSVEPASRPEEVAPRRGRRGGTTLLLLLLAVAAAALGYRYWGFWQTSQPAPSAPPPPTVTVAKPLVKELVEWKDFTGQFQAVESVDVRARVSGYLEIDQLHRRPSH